MHFKVGSTSTRALILQIRNNAQKRQTTFRSLSQEGGSRAGIQTRFLQQQKWFLFSELLKVSIAPTLCIWGSPGVRCFSLHTSLEIHSLQSQHLSHCAVPHLKGIHWIWVPAAIPVSRTAQSTRTFCNGGIFCICTGLQRQYPLATVDEHLKCE